MAYGSTVSTGLTSFIGPPDISGNPKARGTGTKMAMGINATGTSGAYTMVGDIQKKGGTPPTGSSFGTALPNTDVIKSAFLVPASAKAAPRDVTAIASITADNQVTLTGLTGGAIGSAAFLFVIFDQQDKMGAKN